MLSHPFAASVGRVVAGVLATLTLSATVPLRAATITVGATGDLQEALDRARAGDTILLEPGVTYTGSFVLPAKQGRLPIVVRTAPGQGGLPGPAERVDPSHAPLLAKLRSPDIRPIVRTAARGSNWHILLVELVGNGTAGDMVLLGDGSNAQRDLDSMPRNLLLDRVLVRGAPGRSQKRGIALNSGATIIRNSYISDIKAAGLETQAIAGWNGSGPYVIENNFLEAAGINLIFGGTDPTIPGLVPSDITIRRNHLSKRVEWRDSAWTVKNLLELKNARRVLIEGNVLENNWPDGQSGFAVLFTVRNQDGRAPWSTIENVTFRHNIVRHASAGINILGTDNLQQSQTLQGLTIYNNLFDDLNHQRWGGNGVFLQVGGGAVDVRVDHNTVVHTGNLINAYGREGGRAVAMPGFRFTNNIAAHNTNGIFGDAVGTGNPAIAAYFPDGTIKSNVLAGGQASRYPAGNFFPAVTQLLSEFADVANADYRLSSRSPYRTAGSSGSALGVNVDLLNRARAARGR